MLLMLHVDKVHTHDGSRLITENSNPPIDWCTRDTGESSDHVIVILDCARLVKGLLPAFHFPPTSLASFIRKLFRWGFRQVSETYEVANKSQCDRLHTSYMYECPYFRKGNFPLLRQMKSHTAAGARRKVVAHQHDSTELAHQVVGVPTQGNQISQHLSSQCGPTDRTVERSLASMTGTTQYSPSLSPPTGLISRDQNPTLCTTKRHINIDGAVPVMATTFPQMRANPAMQIMVPTLSPVPTSTISAQYSSTIINELAHIEREQKTLQLASEQMRLQQLRRISNSEARKVGEAAALFGQPAMAFGSARGISPPFEMNPINLVKPAATITDFSRLTNQSELNLIPPNTAGGLGVTSGTQGWSHGSAHRCILPASLPYGAPTPPPSLTLPGSIPSPADRSNPTVRAATHGAAANVARIQSQAQSWSTDEALEQQCRLVSESALQQQGVSVEQLFLMQQRQQQQLSQEISSLRSQLGLSSSFGQNRGSIKQSATTVVDESAESQEKPLHPSCFGVAKDDHSTK
jgi:HSF-type DNA-binding